MSEYFVYGYYEHKDLNMQFEFFAIIDAITASSALGSVGAHIEERYGHQGGGISKYVVKNMHKQ